MYAENTSVSTEKSVMEMGRLVRKYGANQFAFMESETEGVVAFVLNGQHVRLSVRLPDRSEHQRTPTGRSRTKASAQTSYEQAVRQKWRALTLVVKAKMEAVEAGVSTFEKEFFAFVVLPDGQTTFEALAPVVNRALEGDTTPLLAITTGRTTP